MTASYAVCDVFDGLASLHLARQRVGMFLEERVVS